MLMSMIKSNTDSTIETSTAAAFAALPAAGEFPKSSLDALTTPLRGVGPATASLVLSVATISLDGDEVPFYSDDVYLWVCLTEYPGMEGNGEKVKYKKDSGELIAKYDVKEYRELWGATRVLRDRLNGFVEGGDGDRKGAVSLIDVERVAYVLRNIGVSGYFDDRVSGEGKDGEEVGEQEVGEQGRRRSKRLKQ
jgi:hypothetical protein